MIISIISIQTTLHGYKMVTVDFCALVQIQCYVCVHLMLIVLAIVDLNYILLLIVCAIVDLNYILKLTVDILRACRVVWMLRRRYKSHTIVSLAFEIKSENLFFPAT